MTGKEILLQAVRNEETPRPAWLPFVGCHGGRIIGAGADDYLHDASLIAAGLRRAHELYQPDGLPIVFDLQVEAEVLGCPLMWAKEGPPSVVAHPLEEGTLADLQPFDTANGRYPIIRQAMAKVKAEMGSEVALYGLICGPFTLALHLMGNNAFLDMLDDSDRVTEVLAFASGVATKAAGFYLDNGADVIALVDPMTSLISPEHFAEFVAPYANPVFDSIRARGAYSSFFVCGDAERNLEGMANTRCDNVSVDENIPLDALRDLAQTYCKSFGGNLKLTVALLLGTEDECKLDAIRCLDVGGTKGFILAPGCDLPFNTPEANLQAVATMVHDEYQREVARATVHSRDMGSLDDIILPDYGSEPSVIVDVITLDSKTCAPCQYMVDVVQRAAACVSAPVTVREHKITSRAGIGTMCKLGVANIPTICIDGKQAFVSIIPDQNTLVRALEERAKAKA